MLSATKNLVIVDDLRLYSDPSPSFLISGRVASHSTGKNLIQYKLIHVHCAKKGAPVPVSHVPSAQLEMLLGTGLRL
jgi:hypothetical protein